MAASPPLPPPPPPPPLAPTTITALGDDILREIFLRLPEITTLARAAFACHAFLRAVRSSPAFRRRFRELRAPPLIAIFLATATCAIVPAAAGKRGDIAAAFAGVLQDSDASEWRTYHYYDWYVVFHNQVTGQCAGYSPHLQALSIFPKNVRGGNCLLEFHTLYPDGEETPPSRVICVYREDAWAWARVAVFSSDTMEWQVRQVVLPDMDTMESAAGLHSLLYRYDSGTAVNGFVCWVHKAEGCILALNTATFQFSRMELPPPIKLPFSMFQLGHTKDKFCVVNVLQCVLSVWLWAADVDGVERFMLHKTFSLRENVSKITKCSEEVDVRMRPMAVINGFVYLSLITDYLGGPPSPVWYLSFCLETAEVNLLHRESKYIPYPADPYIMVSWPSFLIHGKEAQAGVTGHVSEDDGPMGTEVASPVLFIALQSFKEKLIDDGNSNFTGIDSFLLDDERNSLLNRIATLESRLAAATDHVLRIHTEPNSLNGMERVSYWHMCKGMLGRACSRLFAG